MCAHTRWNKTAGSENGVEIKTCSLCPMRKLAHKKELYSFNTANTKKLGGRAYILTSDNTTGISFCICICQRFFALK